MHLPSQALVEANVREHLQASMVTDRVYPMARLTGLVVPAGRVISCVHSVHRLSVGDGSWVNVLGHAHNAVTVGTRGRLDFEGVRGGHDLMLGAESRCSIADPESSIRRCEVREGADLRLQGAVEQLRVHGRASLLSVGPTRCAHLVVEPTGTAAVNGTLGSLHLRPGSAASIKGDVTNYAVIAGRVVISGTAHAVSVLQGGHAELRVAAGGLHIGAGATVVLHSHSTGAVKLDRGGILVLRPGSLWPHTERNEGTIVDERRAPPATEREAPQAGDDPVS
jgi:hypothetical protein